MPTQATENPTGRPAAAGQRFGNAELLTQYTGCDTIPTVASVRNNCHVTSLINSEVSAGKNWTVETSR